jgi:polyhydroxyalkanoate synthesis regulator phasin
VGTVAILQLGFCGSSLRYKTNIGQFQGGLRLIDQLRPITFDWKVGGMHDLGLAAENVEKIEPLLVTYNKDGQVEGVKYDRIGVVLINAIKEQQSQIENQQGQIKRQQDQIKLQNEEARQQRAAVAVQQQQLDALKKLVCHSHRRTSGCR